MQADLDIVRKHNAARVIIIDTETTGLDASKDEVLSVSIVDIYGRTLFDHLIKPQRRKRWPDATAIHGIKWADVKNERTLMDYERELAPYFDGTYLIVGYNIEFDIDMLRASGAVIADGYTFDVMREASSIHGEWSEWKHGRKWMKLTACAAMYGYPEFEAHGSLADAKATAYCFIQLLKDPQYIDAFEAKKAREAYLAKQEADREKLEHEQTKKKSKLVIVVAILVFLFVLAFIFSKWNVLLQS